MKVRSLDLIQSGASSVVEFEERNDAPAALLRKLYPLVPPVRWLLRIALERHQSSAQRLGRDRADSQTLLRPEGVDPK